MLKGKIPIVLAVIFALLAALLAWSALRNQAESIAEGWQPVKVLVAGEDLSPGDTLNEDNLTIGEMPSARVTGSVVTVADHRRTPVFGRKLAVPMLKNDVLLWSHVHTKTGNQRMAEAVQKKGRAVSIRVTPESSVTNWIEPSDRIDILGIFRDPKTGQLISLTMLQNVIVLATGRIGGQTNRNLLSERDKVYNSVTVQVLPEAAEMLILAQDIGTLYLSLRNPEDNEILDIGDEKTTMQTLLTGERSKRISRNQSKIFKVEIIRGRNTEQQRVP